MSAIEETPEYKHLVSLVMDIDINDDHVAFYRTLYRILTLQDQFITNMLHSIADKYELPTDSDVVKLNVIVTLESLTRKVDYNMLLGRHGEVIKEHIEQIIDKVPILAMRGGFQKQSNNHDPKKIGHKLLHTGYY